MGTPISSKVLGPLPGRPPGLGFAGALVGFDGWLFGGPVGLGVDAGDGLDEGGIESFRGG